MIELEDLYLKKERFKGEGRKERKLWTTKWQRVPGTVRWQEKLLDRDETGEIDNE